MRLAVEVRASVAPTREGHFHRTVIGERNRPVGQRMRRNGYQRNRRQIRMHDRPIGRERVSGRAGRRGHDETVGALVVHKAPVDVDGQFNHAADRTTAHHHVVQCQRIEQYLPLARHRTLQNMAVFGFIHPTEDGIERSDFFVECDVGHETQAPLVDTDQRDFVRCQDACNRQHGAVTTDHDGAIGLSAEILHRHSGIVSNAGVAGGVRLDQYAASRFLQIRSDLAQRFCDSLTLILANDGDRFEGCGHQRIKP